MIKEYESGTFKQTELESKYGIGKSTVSDILKQRDVLKKEWENNGSKSKTRFTYACKYSDVNELTFEWFKQARAKNVPISLNCEVLCIVYY